MIPNHSSGDHKYSHVNLYTESQNTHQKAVHVFTLFKVNMNDNPGYDKLATKAQGDTLHMNAERTI